jgi:hypothetical protein
MKQSNQIRRGMGVHEQPGRATCHLKHRG